MDWEIHLECGIQYVSMHNQVKALTAWVGLLFEELSSSQPHTREGNGFTDQACPTRQQMCQFRWSFLAC